MPDGWRRRSIAERVEILHRAAAEFAAARGDLMGAMLAEGGKTLAESDPEVSEAIDFCRFYADSAEFFHNLPSVAAQGRGVVVVVSPWNFPLAIPCGGVAAALAAGNTVILKPASDTVLIAYQLCQCFWRAGVPKTALQFAPCSGGTVGAAARDARRRRRGRPHRRHRNRRRNAPHETDDASARRNRRQERHDRHRAFRPRPGDQERAPQRVQPQRPKMLGHVAA